MHDVLDQAALVQLDEHMPGFRAEVEPLELSALERPGGPGIAAFKAHGGPGLLVPADFGGAGLSAIAAMKVQRAIGRLAPSTAIATTMHQFSIATLVEATKLAAGMEWLVIESVARQQLLVASGFAEGDPSGQVLRPRVEVRPDVAGYRVSGTKKPCSLSSSMDMLAVSLIVPAEDGGEKLGVALVSAKDPGLSVHPLWTNPVLSGAETGVVVLKDVRVPEAVMSYAGAPDDLDELQIRGYVWFELLIASAYVGIASRLVADSVRTAGARSDAAIAAVAQIEAAIAALEGVGNAFEHDIAVGHGLLARTLLVRQGVEKLIEHATDLAFQLVGAMTFATSSDAAVLLAASRALAWHPPSQRRARDSLASHIEGHGLTAF